MADGALLIACGALARELVELRRRNAWEHIRILCLPADLHHTPSKIAGAVADAIEKNRDKYESIFVVYADCGTNGSLDRVLDEYGIERISGAHCYQFFAGESIFDTLSEEEPGTFYLTDFLVRHFDRLVVKGLGLDRHPELKSLYFGNYKRVVYLVQTHSEKLSERAREQADYLGLEYIEHNTGLDPFDSILKEQVIEWRN
jgi:hypothetical protein